MMMLEFFPKVTPGHILRKFAFYFPLGLVAVLVFFWIIARVENEQILLMTAHQEVGHLRQAQNLIAGRLSRLSRDLANLAESRAMKSFVDSPAPPALLSLGDRLHSFVEDEDSCEWVSFFDRSGRPLAGVDRHGQPAGETRSGKAGEQVGETLELRQGEFSVSVSNEEGRGEATLHIGTPVFDSAGAKSGMVMLSCRTERILDHFTDLFDERGSDSIHIIDSAGLHLSRSSSGRDEPALAAHLPELWQAVQNKISGQFSAAGGLVSFVRIQPTLQVRGTTVAADAVGGEHGGQMAQQDGRSSRDYAWYILLYRPVPDISSFAIFRDNARAMIIPLCLAVLLAGSLHLAINRATRERSDRALELLSTAVEQSPAATIITDKNGLIRYANPKFLSLSGYSREEIVGRKPNLFKSGKTPPEVYQNLWQTVEAGLLWTGEFVNRRKDGTQYIVAAKISPILRKSGVIGGYLAIQDDITERRRLEKQLEHLATIDGLTGIYNRSYFFHLFGQELRREERYGQPLCLLVFDLDHFKTINDSYGHQAGDRVLEEFARLVSSTLRDTDFFGRLGGEEFGAVLLQTDHEGAMLLAERLRAAVEKMRITCEGSIIRITVSIGGTQWHRSDHKIESILNRADNALYEAKRLGRNQVCFRIATEDIRRS